MAAYALIVGDAFVDRYLHGTFSAASVDAGFPCVGGAAETVRPGGAAGIAAYMRALGQDVRLIGAAGNDPAKAMLLKVLADNVVTCRLFECPDQRTHIREHTVVAGRTILRSDCASGEYTNEAGVLQAAAGCLQPLEGANDIRLLILADLGHGTLTQAMAQNLIAVAANNRIPVFATTTVADHVDWFRGVSVLQLDIATAMGHLDAVGNVHPGLAHDDPGVVAGVAAPQLQASHAWGVVITRGTADVVVATPGSVQFLPAKQQATLSDAFAGGLAVRLIEGYGIDIEFAGWAALLAVKNATPVLRIHVENALSNILASFDGALTYARHARVAGQTLALVADYFDPIHAGQLDVLLAAPAFADAVLVAYADDASAQVKAGGGRVSIPAVKRAQHLAAIRGISRAFPFTGDALSLVKAFHPDVYVASEHGLLHGPVPAADYVASYGGRVEFVKAS